MKTNYKRAIKAINKLGDKRFFVQYIDDGKMVLLSEGHMIVAIPVLDFEEYKSELKGTIVEFDLLDNFNKAIEGEAVDLRMTTVKITCNYETKDCRVFKGDGILTVVNEAFLDVIRDTFYVDYIATGLKTHGNKAPLFYADKVYDAETSSWKVVGGFMILPICMSVRDVLSNVLG
jgi:hypothetical protein